MVKKSEKGLIGKLKDSVKIGLGLVAGYTGLANADSFNVTTFGSNLVANLAYQSSHNSGNEKYDPADDGVFPPTPGDTGTYIELMSYPYPGEINVNNKHINRESTLPIILHGNLRGSLQSVLNAKFYFGVNGHEHRDLKIKSIYSPDNPTPTSSEYSFSEGTIIEWPGYFVKDTPRYFMITLDSKLAGDISGPEGLRDGQTDIYDLAKLSEEWLDTTTPEQNLRVSDINRDGITNLEDLARLSSTWMQSE